MEAVVVATVVEETPEAQVDTFNWGLDLRELVTNDTAEHTKAVPTNRLQIKKIKDIDKD